MSPTLKMMRRRGNCKAKIRLSQDDAGMRLTHSRVVGRPESGDFWFIGNPRGRWALAEGGGGLGPGFSQQSTAWIEIGYKIYCNQFSSNRLSPKILGQTRKYRCKTGGRHGTGSWSFALAHWGAVAGDHSDRALLAPLIAYGLILLFRRTIMSGTTDKIKGLGNEAIGSAKQNIGKAVGSDKLEAEGAVQEIKGKVQKAVGDAKNAAKEAAHKIDDAASRNL
jgi:uncharacterized protein YjbJ (UPF0337 family)